MSIWFPIAAILSLAFCLMVIAGEYVRTRGGRFDCFTVFLCIYFLQCLAPSAVIFSCLTFNNGRGLSLGNAFFDHVYESIEGYQAALVGGMGAAFLIIAYITYQAILSDWNRRLHRPRMKLVLRPRAFKVLVVLGFLSGFVLIFTLGDSLVNGYKALVRFRNLDESIERTFLTANLFSLTQTFLLLGFPGLFLAKKWRAFSLSFVAWVSIIGALSLFCVSRRSILIPIILFVFTILLAGKRPKLWQLVVFCVAGVAVMFVGKQLLSFLADSTEEWRRPTRDPLNNVLYVASDLGVTITESLGTLALIDVPPRLGVDHVLSALRRIPDAGNGIKARVLPERFVRFSTRVFTSAEDQDIPPGFIGMMWVDFRFAGPIVYGLLWGAALGMIERFRLKFIKDLQSSSIFAVALYVFCLPLNTGSLDFTFSVDIIILAVFSLFVLNIKRIATQPMLDVKASAL